MPVTPRTASPAAAAPDMADLADIAKVCIGLHTRMTARAVARVYDDALRDIGLKGTQLILLAALKGRSAASLTALADRMALDRTTLSRNLRVLESAGLVVPAGSGGRAASFRVTAEGEALIAAAIPRWRAAQEAIVAAFGTGAWDTTRADLRRLRSLVHKIDLPAS